MTGVSTKRVCMHAEVRIEVEIVRDLVVLFIARFTS